jgi:probable rRNA maturation factor
MKLHVDVQRATEATDVPDDEWLQRWAHAATEQILDADAQLSIRVVDIEEGIDLNESYRRGEGPTNVLAFAFEERERLDPPLLGDVVICAPVVQREAAEQGTSMHAHFAHLVVHGVLHLLGHDHQREAQAQHMEAIERTVLGQLGFDDPYIERDAVGLPWSVSSMQWQAR